MSAPALIVAAPSSGSGKTLVTLALLRCYRNQGLAVGSFKVGPDYIDPGFHAAASGRPCANVDGWAMRPATRFAAYSAAVEGAELALGEGVMGLFDGAGDGAGSTGALAAELGLPVVLVVDVRGQAASVAALVHGFRSFRVSVRVAGVICNRVSSATHERLLKTALQESRLPVLGFLPTDAALDAPERHLGLVQAGERADLEEFLDRAAAFVGAHVDVYALMRLARPAHLFRAAPLSPPLPPLGQRIAVAQDIAFGFAYDGVLDGWRRLGAEIVPFSPLANELPDPAADAIYLPGGYPELHAGKLAGAGRFFGGLRHAAARGATIYGECGGYMALGLGLEDADGARHAMAGLLPLETTFAQRRLSLGYRQVALAAAGPLGPVGAVYRGHEFHYAGLLGAEGAQPLFQVRDSTDRDLGLYGAQAGAVAGSFIHLIDRVGR